MKDTIFNPSPISHRVDVINAEDQTSSYSYLVNVFDHAGVRVEQKKFKTYKEAQSFMVEETRKGYDTHLSRLQLITE